jgi:simple sugar transport system substrate-binding protein
MRRLLMMTALAFVAVAGSQAAAAAADNCAGKAKHSIYYATHAIPDPFWAILKRGAEQGAKDACLDFKWTQDVNFSVQTTIERMETAIAEKPDMLVITATDAQAMRPTLERAKAAGIPVIAVNVADPAPKLERLPYLIYIGADQYQIGVAGANEVLAKDKPKLAACFNAFPGHVGLELLCAGWADTFKKAGVKAEQIDAHGSATDAEAALTAYLTKNPDLGAIFTVSDAENNFGVALATLKKQNLIGKVDLVTFNASAAVIASIQAGETLAGIDQQGYLQGYLPAILTRLYLDAGLMPGADILTGPGVVNKSNLDAVIAGAKAGLR